MDDANPAPEPVETMDEGMAVAEEGASEGEEIRAFVPADFFKGRKMEVGDTETVRVESIDPETGEHEIVCTYKGGEDRKSMGDMMDEAIPEV